MTFSDLSLLVLDFLLLSTAVFLLIIFLISVSMRSTIGVLQQWVVVVFSLNSRLYFLREFLSEAVVREEIVSQELRARRPVTGVESQALLRDKSR